METSATLSDLAMAELAKAIAQAQAEMPPVKFDAVNPFLKSSYATLGAIIETARPILAKYGLSVIQLPFGNGEHVGVETIILHASGAQIASSIALPVGDEKGKSMAQVAGSIISYLRRYSYASALGIYAEEDNDGELPSRGSSKAAAKTPSKAPSKPQDEPPSTNGSGRPLSPAKLREMISLKAGTVNQSKTANDKQRALLAMMLDIVCEGDKDRRHTITGYLTGLTSTKDLSGPLVVTLLDWLKPTKDDGGAYIPDPYAEQEARAVWTAALTEEGQEPLPFD